MKFNYNNERILAFNKAQEIELTSLSKICGGSSSGTTNLTTKETFNQFGNWDVGGDVQWD